MAELTGALTATGATLAFDAIGRGQLASQILTGMEAAAAAAAGGYSRYGSAVHKQVYIYGSLDRGPTELTSPQVRVCGPLLGGHRESGRGWSRTCRWVPGDVAVP